MRWPSVSDVVGLLIAYLGMLLVVVMVGLTYAAIVNGLWPAALVTVPLGIVFGLMVGHIVHAVITGWGN